MAYRFLRLPFVFAAASLIAVASLPSDNAIQRFPPAAGGDDFDAEDDNVGSHMTASLDVTRPRLNHMAIDPSTGSIYIGAVNHLYRLDPDHLAIIGSRSLGPRPDDRRCTESFGAERCGAGGSTTYPARLTDNFVKVLAVDAARHQLVVCGSTFQGTCELLDLDIGGAGTNDLSSPSSSSLQPFGGSIDGSAAGSRPTRGNTDYFVAANDPGLSTVGYVAPGPGGQTVLYVAASYSGTASVLQTATSTSNGISGSGPSPPSSLSSSASMSSSSSAVAAISAVRQAVPAVSSRSLTPGPGAFRFVHVDGLTGGTAVRFRSEAIERFPVEYVSGFDGGDGFSYLVAIQPESFEMSGAGVLPPIVSAHVGSRIIQV